MKSIIIYITIRGNARKLRKRATNNSFRNQRKPIEFCRSHGCEPPTRRFWRSTRERWRTMHVSRSPTRPAVIPAPVLRPAPSVWQEVAKLRRKSSTARGACTFVSWRSPTGIATCARSTPVRWNPSWVASTYSVRSFRPLLFSLPSFIPISSLFSISIIVKFLFGDTAPIKFPSLA